MCMYLNLVGALYLNPMYASIATRSAIYPFPRVESQKQSGAELKEDGGGKRKAENTGRGLKKSGTPQ